MPTNKDLKRLVRARMAKTGESYTAALAHIVAAAEAPLSRSPLPEDYERRAGMSDEKVRDATGKSWPEWVETLDAIGATGLEHGEIARQVHEAHGVPGWWSQTVTVGYERLRGLRDVGQRRGGGYEVNKSKTVAVPIEEMWHAFADEGARARWLDDEALTFHHLAHPKSIRGRRADGTKVDVYFVAKGEAKTSVSIQHRDLPDKEAAADARTRWGVRLDALAKLLLAHRA